MRCNNCNNCGYAESFVLLVELATLVTPDALADPDHPSGVDAPAVEVIETPPADDSPGGERSRERSWSLAVQCPACGSTDVGVDATELLAYVSTTRS